jgi:RNA polymerase sigma factor for flagellar operon FliA
VDAEALGMAEFTRTFPASAPERRGRPAAPVPGADGPLDQAAGELVLTHLPVVGYLVSEVISRLPSHIQREDLVSAGQLALVKAARGYDASSGVPFGHYARTRIRGGLVDELRSADWASRGVRSRARDISRAEDVLAAELGRWPADAEVAAAIQADVAAVRSTRADVHRGVVMSLDELAAVHGSADEHLAPGSHTVDASQQVVHAERVRYLESAVRALPERLRLVVEQYFLGERPMAEIAQQLGVTESRVSQLRAEALVLLRDGINSHLDPEAVTPPERDGVVSRRRAAYYAQVASYAAASMPVQQTVQQAVQPVATRYDDRLHDITRTA